MEREIEMSAKGYENQLIEQVKVLEEDNREIKREMKKLKKRKRKLKRLEDHEAEMLAIYEKDYELNNQEIESLLTERSNINFREEEESNVSTDDEYDY